MSRTARLERLRSTQDVEKAAGMIATLVGGNVIDEDGFLVGLEETSGGRGGTVGHLVDGASSSPASVAVFSYPYEGKGTP